MQLVAEIRGSGLLSRSLSSSLEFLVERSFQMSGFVGGGGRRGRRRAFRLTPDSVARRMSRRREREMLAKAPKFCFSGLIQSDVVAANGSAALEGEFVVGEETEAEVRSVEVQLMRAETVDGIRFVSEIQVRQFFF